MYGSHISYVKRPRGRCKDASSFFYFRARRIGSWVDVASSFIFLLVPSTRLVKPTG
nr:MAG TPA: hypothetical protein [Bacteriophage sp.]